MTFEKFYIIDTRGPNNQISLKFVHIENGRSILATTASVVKILQYGEIKIQTKFATPKFTSKYSKYKHRNLRSIKNEFLGILSLFLERQTYLVILLILFRH
jgi:hypothetical protein